MDTRVAITATARELTCLIYLMMTRGQEYTEKGMQACEWRRLSRKFSSLRRQARKLGYHLVETADGRGNAKGLGSVAKREVTQEGKTRQTAQIPANYSSHQHPELLAVGAFVRPFA